MPREYIVRLVFDVYVNVPRTRTHAHAHTHTRTHTLYRTRTHTHVWLTRAQRVQVS
jgi:hypothetical protein